MWGTLLSWSEKYPAQRLHEGSHSLGTKKAWEWQCSSERSREQFRIIWGHRTWKCGVSRQKGPESSPDLRPEHYHGISLPCFFSSLISFCAIRVCFVRPISGPPQGWKRPLTILSPRMHGSTVRRTKLTDRSLFVSVINQPSLGLPRIILGSFWLRESLHFMKVQDYRHPVYRPEVFLRCI